MRPEPKRAVDLAREIAEKTGLASLRFSGDPDTMVRTVGNAVGGLGLASNRYWMRRQIENGADALICGEMDELAMMFAGEYNDTVLIETSHALSENIGVRHFANMLAEEFPDVETAFFEVARPFHIVGR